MSKTKKELRELEAIVNLYKEQPDNLVNKIWSWRKKALQAKEEEVGEKVERLKLETDVVVCDCGRPYKDSDLADLINEWLSSLKKGEKTI